MQLSEAPPDYRRKSLGMAVLLLFFWSGVTFCIPFFARELGFKFAGWPFSFWACAQGAMGVYLLMIAGYCVYMNRLDEKYGLTDEYL